MSQFLVIMNLKWVCEEDVKRTVILTNALNDGEEFQRQTMITAQEINLLGVT